MLRREFKNHEGTNRINDDYFVKNTPLGDIAKAEKYLEKATILDLMRSKMIWTFVENGITPISNASYADYIGCLTPYRNKKLIKRIGYAIVILGTIYFGISLFLCSHIANFDKYLSINSALFVGSIILGNLLIIWTIWTRGKIYRVINYDDRLCNNKHALPVKFREKARQVIKILDNLQKPLIYQITDKSRKKIISEFLVIRCGRREYPVVAYDRATGEIF
jgi:hypothetical protein